MLYHEYCHVLLQEIVLNIDLAPTFMDLAGLDPLDDMDGRSIKSVLNASSTKVVSGWREDFLVEHNGEYGDETEGCPQYNNQKMSVSTEYNLKYV